MTLVKSLRLLSAVLGSAAVCAVVVTTVLGDVRPGSTSVPAAPVAAATPKFDANKVIDELAKTKFSDKPVLAYKTPAGETIFAWQVKPVLPASAPRPRDILVLVDTSASQAGDPMKQAGLIIETLGNKLGADDRLDIWTLNINGAEFTRSLTAGFKSPTDKLINETVLRLGNAEYAAGAIDLKAGLETAVKSFEQKAGRQQIVLFLGDGESTSGTPITEKVRVELGEKLVDKNAQFFAVPLGLTVSANNLHGLSMSTGGCVIRAKENLAGTTGSTEFTKRLTAAFDVPVLKADKTTFAIAGIELLPNRLPPLRADRGTLVLGKLTGPVANLAMKIDGRVGDKKTSVDLAERLPAASVDHFFLSAMLDQWTTAGSKDAPVILAADRALAMAGEQFRLFRDEFVELGMKAISADRFDHAEKLFQAAVRIDPSNAEAIAGTKVVAQLRSGATTKEKLKARVDKNEKAGRALISLQEPAPGAVSPPALPPAGGIQRAQAARAAADQEARAIVEETLKQVRVLKSTDPDRAVEDLKRQRETVLLNSDLSDDVRRRLTSDLEASMRDIQVQGAEIKRRLSAERDRISQARYRLNENDRILSQEEQTKARIDRFRDLMSQARFELAYQEAQVMAQERISRGLAVPPEVTATYRIGQSATNLREFNELKRIREDRYLMCMLQVEKSFIPYPDEPPVHFPPAQVWRELTANRKENYTTYEIGGDPTARQRMKKVRSILEDQRVNFPNSLKDTPLRTLKEQLEKQFDIKIVVREDLFKLEDMADGEIMDRKFKLDSNLSGVTLGSFLDVALLDIKASYIVRPEYIEITTLAQRLEEKVTLAFAVADLVLAIPSSVNPQTLQQNSQFQASQLSIFGVGQAQQFGNAGFGGNNGGFNGGGGGFNGGGGGAFGGGMLGMGGGGMLGIAGGQLGQGGQGNNLGVGGGALGATGGQLGQFGNLGGQFGIQGNDQSRFLTALIQTVVARGEWDSVIPGVPPPPASPEGEAAPTVPPAQLNSLGFYPPVRALVIRGSTRYHPTQSFKLRVPGAAGGVQANPPGGKPNGLGQAEAPRMLNPNEDPRAMVKAAKGDMKKVWNEALGKFIDDPMLAVNAIDIMNEAKEYDQTAEVLKATIRHGRANANWTHEALALALQSSKASPAEIERASLSGIDLDPTNAKEYIKAAKAESELKNNGAAIELCKRAAALEPNMPDAYANALVYVERSSDVATDVVGWATENLMKRDWTNDGVDYTKQTKARVGKIAKKLTDAGRNADADLVNKGLAESKVRDLLVELRWQGQGDLDLIVAEPSGSTASATSKRTSGGGVLKCDILEQGDDDRSESYSASEAFTGTYKVTVKTSLGRTVGNKALVKVTKFPGTPKESFEIFAIDMNDPKPIEFKLDGGSRKDLANVPAEDSEARLVTTAAPKSYVPSGVGGGAGLASPDLTVFTGGNAGANMPLVTPSVETKFDSISPSLPGIRVVGKVSSDRSMLEYTASTVFTGPAVDIPTPKVNLLPGSDRSK